MLWTGDVGFAGAARGQWNWEGPLGTRSVFRVQATCLRPSLDPLHLVLSHSTGPGSDSTHFADAQTWPGKGRSCWPCRSWACPVQPTTTSPSWPVNQGHCMDDLAMTQVCLAVLSGSPRSFLAVTSLESLAQETGLCPPMTPKNSGCHLVSKQPRTGLLSGNAPAHRKRGGLAGLGLPG